MANTVPLALSCSVRAPLSPWNAVSFYHLSVTIHVIAAVFWLGGMLFLASVGAPVLRKVDPELRAKLFLDLGRQFRWVSWIAIVTLLVTGLTNLHFRGLLDWRLLGNPAFWGTTQGGLLAWKLLLVFVMVGIAAIHDFVVGPRSSRCVESDGNGDYEGLRRAASYMGRLNVVLALILLYVAARLTRG